MITINTIPNSNTYHVYEKPLNIGFESNFRTQTKGNSNPGNYITTVRAGNDIPEVPEYGSGLAFGAWDTHGFLIFDRNNPRIVAGGGAANELRWLAEIAFKTDLEKFLPALGTTISANIDWNTIINPGTYKIQYATMDEEHHAPVNEFQFGILFVLKPEGDSGEKRTLQIFFPALDANGIIRTSHMFSRMSNTSTSSGETIWSEWTYSVNPENVNSVLNKKQISLTKELTLLAGSYNSMGNGNNVKELGYFKLATITVLAQYAGSAISFQYKSRNNVFPTTVYVMFSNSSSLDPELNKFRFSGCKRECYIHKSATSQWDIYIKKSELNDYYDIYDFNNTTYNNIYLKIEWKNEVITELPENAIPAIEWHQNPLNSTLDNEKFVKGCIDANDPSGNRHVTLHWAGSASLPVDKVTHLATFSYAEDPAVYNTHSEIRPIAIENVRTLLGTEKINKISEVFASDPTKNNNVFKLINGSAIHNMGDTITTCVRPNKGDFFYIDENTRISYAGSSYVVPKGWYRSNTDIDLVDPTYMEIFSNTAYPDYIYPLITHSIISVNGFTDPELVTNDINNIASIITQEEESGKILIGHKYELRNAPSTIKEANLYLGESEYWCPGILEGRAIPKGSIYYVTSDVDTKIGYYKLKIDVPESVGMISSAFMMYDLPNIPILSSFDPYDESYFEYLGTSYYVYGGMPNSDYINAQRSNMLDKIKNILKDNTK